MLANTPPFFVLLLGWLFLGERITAAGLVGLVIGFAGVVVMVSSQLAGVRDTADLVLGMGLALAAAGWGVTTLLVKWLADRDPQLDVLGLTAGQFVVAGAGLGILAFAVDGTGGTEWASGKLWSALVWLAIGASAVTSRSSPR